MLKKTKANETFLENDLFNQLQSPLVLDFLNSDNLSSMKTDSLKQKTASLSKTGTKGTLRENSFGFTLFLLTLAQTNQRAQL